MTIELSNEQAANELKAMQEHVEPYMSVVGLTAYNMAIKALEQQPYRKSGKVVAELKLDKKFIDEAVQKAVKDIKQNYIKEDVLDKIRAEIENHCGLAKENHCRYCCYCTNLMGVREILEVIDKHMVESEDKE